MAPYEPFSTLYINFKISQSEELFSGFVAILKTCFTVLSNIFSLSATDKFPNLKKSSSLSLNSHNHNFSAVLEAFAAFIELST